MYIVVVVGPRYILHASGRRSGPHPFNISFSCSLSFNVFLIASAISLISFFFFSFIFTIISLYIFGWMWSCDQQHLKMCSVVSSFPHSSHLFPFSSKFAHILIMFVRTSNIVLPFSFSCSLMYFFNSLSSFAIIFVFSFM